jgi:hypothetical protein
MSSRNKIIVTAALLLVITGLGAADYYVSGDGFGAQVANPNTPAPTGAVAKASGPSIENVAQTLNLETSKSDDLSLLAQAVTDGTQVESTAILHDGDRAGSVTWVESANVKNYFIAIKEALLSAFSNQVSELRDETLQEADKPVRNILTFKDPQLSDERILFVRVRERLYEFHIADGQEETMNKLVEALTGR